MTVFEIQTEQLCKSTDLDANASARAHGERETQTESKKIILLLIVLGYILCDFHSHAKSTTRKEMKNWAWRWNRCIDTIDTQARASLSLSISLYQSVEPKLYANVVKWCTMCSPFSRRETWLNEAQEVEEEKDTFEKVPPGFQIKIKPPSIERGVEHGKILRAYLFPPN